MGHIAAFAGEARCFLEEAVVSFATRSIALDTRQGRGWESSFGFVKGRCCGLPQGSEPQVILMPDKGLTTYIMDRRRPKPFTGLENVAHARLVLSHVDSRKFDPTFSVPAEVHMAGTNC